MPEIKEYIPERDDEERSLLKELYCSISSSLECKEVNKLKYISHEAEFMKEYDNADVISNLYKDYLKYNPNINNDEYIKEAAEKYRKYEKLTNQILYILSTEKGKLNNSVILFDVPWDMWIVLNEEFKNIKFNTFFVLSPSWPKDKNKRPIVNYDSLFSMYAYLSKEWKITSEDKYKYEQDNKHRKYEPLVWIYDYNRYPNKDVKITNNDFVNSYSLDEDSFPEKDFYWENKREKLIVFSMDPVSKEVYDYIEKIKDKWINVELFLINPKDLSIEWNENLSEVTENMVREIKDQENFHWWGSHSAILWYYLMNHNNEANRISSSLNSRKISVRHIWRSIRGHFSGRHWIWWHGW